MVFLTKTINFIKPEGRGSTYRVAQIGTHKFVVVFDEDMDMRVCLFLQKLLERGGQPCIDAIDFIGERKGTLTVVINPSSVVAEGHLSFFTTICEDIADKELADDSWNLRAYVGYQLRPTNGEDCMSALFHPLNHRGEALAQLFAALKVARGQSLIEVPQYE